MLLFRWLFRCWYVLRRSLTSMIRNFGVSLSAITTIALCMFLLCSAVLGLLNLRRLAASWNIDVPLTVYIDHEAGIVRTQALRDSLERRNEVLQAEVISPKEALQHLRTGLGANHDLLDGIDESYFPYTIELALDEDERQNWPAFVIETAKLPGVARVVAPGQWLENAQDTVLVLEQVGLAAGILVSLACVGIVWNTIRLGVVLRARELEVMGYVGASASFMRGPFLVEGVTQGALGMALAQGLLYVLFYLCAPILEQGLALLLAAQQLVYFSQYEVALAIVFSAALGMLGARLAVSQHILKVH